MTYSCRNYSYRVIGRYDKEVHHPTSLLLSLFETMDSRISVSSSQIYHEHQVKQFCALHALNNLYGESCFTKKSLDDICERLAPTKGWGNPHRSFFGFGNWDVNVVMVAVQSKNCEAVWWDKRNDLANLDLKNIVGFILNIPNDYAIGSFKLPLGRRHWISIRAISTAGSPVFSPEGVTRLEPRFESRHEPRVESRVESRVEPRVESRVEPRLESRHEPRLESRRLFYNLDSKFKTPLLIGNETAVLSFLQDALTTKGGEMLVVVAKDTL